MSLGEWDVWRGTITMEVVNGKLEGVYSTEVIREASKEQAKREIFLELEKDILPALEDEFGIKATNLQEV